MQKSEIINTRKQEASEQAYRETLLGYEQAIAEAAEKAQEHAESLRREALFGIGEGGSAALGQAVTASESQLLQMLDVANLTGDTNIAKAAFAAAWVRGDAPMAVRRYLEANPNAEGLLRLYERAPKADWVEEQRSNATQLVKRPTPERLRSYARVGR